MSETGLVQVIEGALMAAGAPLTVARIAELFDEGARPENSDIREALKEVAERCEGRGFEVMEVAGGFRYQVRQSLSTWVARLWQERPQKYSRAMLETLALIAYRQPITRGEIEEIRGVAVSSSIIKTLHEREWVRVVGHRDVPGRPAMYATTRVFLDYFNLKTLDQLPALAEIRDFDTLTAELGFTDVSEEPKAAENVSVEGSEDTQPQVDSSDEQKPDAGAGIDQASPEAEEPSDSAEMEDENPLTVVGGTDHAEQNEEAGLHDTGSLDEPGKSEESGV